MMTPGAPRSGPLYPSEMAPATGLSGAGGVLGFAATTNKAAAMGFGGGLGLVDSNTKIAVVDNTGARIPEHKIVFGRGGGSLATHASLHWDRVNERLGVQNANPMAPLSLGNAAGLEFTPGASQAWIQCYNRTFGEYKKLQFDAHEFSFTRSAGVPYYQADPTAGSLFYNLGGSQYFQIGNSNIVNTMPFYHGNAVFSHELTASIYHYQTTNDGNVALNFLRHYVSTVPLPRFAHGLNSDSSWVMLSYDNSGDFLRTVMSIERLTGRVSFTRFLKLENATNSSPEDGDIWFEGGKLKVRESGVTHNVI